MKFTYGGETFEMVDVDTLTFAEGAAACRAAKCKAAELDGSTFESMQALIWVTLKRRKPELKFSDLSNVPFGEFEFIDAEPEDDESPDPTEVEETSTTSD